MDASTLVHTTCKVPWLLAVDTIFYYWNDKNIYGIYSHFQEDSNILKHVLFGYYTTELWIFEVSIIAFFKTWIASTKTVIQHDL